MENKAIITISRQFGNGGHEVDKKITDQLGVPFYNRGLIEIATKESGMNKGLFKEGNAHTSRGFRLLGTLGYSLGGPLSTITGLSLNDRLHLIQEEVIKGVACKGSCVIVGRYAGCVLRDRSDVLNVYTHTDMEDRKECAVHSYEMDERDTEGSIKKINKRRVDCYEYYADRKWGRVENYDIGISSSTFGIDGTVEIIKMLTQKKAL